MLAILHSLGMFIVDLFKSQRRLEAENLFLRHQLSIALRRAPPRLRLRGSDRALLVWMTCLWPSLLGAADLAAISLVVFTPSVLVVHSDVPAKNVQELVALARAHRASSPMGMLASAHRRTFPPSCSSRLRV